MILRCRRCSFTGTSTVHLDSCLAVGDKAVDFAILDRTNGELVDKLAVSNQQGIFTTVPTVAGTFACPNHGGGIEWNGGSYDAATNLFFIPSTQECAIWKIIFTGSTVRPGQAYTAGPLPKRRPATGVFTATTSRRQAGMDEAISVPARAARSSQKRAGVYHRYRRRIYALETKTGQAALARRYGLHDRRADLRLRAVTGTSILSSRR